MKTIVNIFLFLTLYVSSVFSENPDTALEKIRQNFTYIRQAGEYFNIDTACLAAIIFTERTLNYDWSNEALDVILAKSGQNSTIGFCQIKLRTAYWIEVQLNDSTALYYPGQQYTGVLRVSQSPRELIAKLTDDSLNIMYAAAYVHIIQSRWENAGYAIDYRPNIVGTLFSTGLFHADGSERKPRENPQANSFGLKVNEVMEEIIRIFPDT